MRKPGPSKIYDKPEVYERKLHKVMKRLGGQDVNWDYSRREAWVTFVYKDQFYRFDHNIDKASSAGKRLYYGSDCFAQIVLALEDIARMAQRGIYELQTWIEGMKALPPGEIIPDFLFRLGFTSELPSDEAEITTAYREAAKTTHPDAGGDPEEFNQLQQDRDQALQWLAQRLGGRGDGSNLAGTS